VTLQPPLVSDKRFPRQAPEGIAIQSVVLTPVAALPADPVEGQMVRLISDGLVHVYSGGAWRIDSGGGGSGFSFYQATPILVWDINHTFSYRPAGVRVIDLTGAEVIGEVTYPTASQVRITFLLATAGYAYLS